MSAINWRRNGASASSSPKRFGWKEVSEDLPVDVMPCSNDEYFPPPPSVAQRQIMDLASRESERQRTKFGMTRAQFVRTAAATVIGFWAIDLVRMGRFGTYGYAQAGMKRPDACDLDFTGGKGLESLRNLPGEFIFDVQSHHVDPDGMWRVSNPAFEAFFSAVWPQAREGGEVDPIQNLSRFHYLKEVFLDSATTMSVLSVVPTSPDTQNPLPLAEASETVNLVNDLGRSRRCVMHAFVMPNRGSGGRNTPGVKPLHLDEELNLMMERAKQYKHILRGWKTYCAWGDVPNASGWFFDTDTGQAFLEQVVNVSNTVKKIPPVVATHKGFALPGFDQTAATPRDVGVAAPQHPGVRFIVYHSGYDIGDDQGPYRGDEKANSSTNTVDGLIKALRENNYDATKFVKKGKRFGNCPNVYAELGSVWRNTMHDPDQCAHLLGKLITYVGPKRIAWGTDSLWYGSPQPEIIGMRKFEFTDEGKEMYGLPYGMEGDVEDPTRPAPNPARTIRNGILGRNAARAYEIDADARRHEIHCDDVNKIREDGYLHGKQGDMTESAPLASHVSPGARTRREVWKSLTESEWSP